jgi:hypothetical protein
MNTVEKWALALNRAISFVDQFGENYGETKFKEMIKIETEGNRIIITNKYGTIKSFVFGNSHTRQIYDEIASNLEGFKTPYRVYVNTHQGFHAGKVITTLTTKLLLSNGSSREHVAVVTLKNREVSVRYEIAETFTEEF